MKKLIVPFLIITGILFSQCKKEEENFTYCNGCPISSWVGYYSGTGAYYTVASGETVDGLEVNLTVQNPYDSNLRIRIEVPDVNIDESYSKNKTDDNYYILFGSGASTLDVGLRQKGNELRIDGVLKKSIWNKIDSVWVVDQSLTFETNKVSK